METSTLNNNNTSSNISTSTLYNVHELRNLKLILSGLILLFIICIAFSFCGFYFFELLVTPCLFVIGMLLVMIPYYIMEIYNFKNTLTSTSNAASNT